MQSAIFVKSSIAYVRTNQVAGTGLGPICKQIVQGHGGTIEIKSKLGLALNVLVGLPRWRRRIAYR
jgi:signal transduction histidine kinase